MRKYNPTNSKVSVDETGKVSFTTQSIQEARITIHNAMFNFMNKEIKQLMKKHDAYVNKGESDKTYTTISTPSPDFDKDYSALMKKHKKKIIQHFKIESVQEAMKMKDILRKHKRELQKAVRSGNLELSDKAEEDLMHWAMDNGEVNTDDPDDFIEWLDKNLDDIVKGRIK